jgi:hypothetical protein
MHVYVKIVIIVINTATCFGAYCTILMESFKTIGAKQAKSINYKNIK